MGRQLAAEIDQRFPPLADPDVTQYVRDVGHRVAVSLSLPYPLTVKLYETNERLANALPGGYLVASSGLLRALASESELAAIMAHELAHMAARHGMQQVARGQASNAASMPMIFLGGWGGVCARFQPKVLLPFARRSTQDGFEREADRMALGYLYDAGYDAEALRSAFERLQPSVQMQPLIINTSRFDEIQRRLSAASTRKQSELPSLQRSESPK